MTGIFSVGSTLPCRPRGTSQSCCHIWTDKLFIHIIAGDPVTVFFSAWKYAKLLAGQVSRKGLREASPLLLYWWSTNTPPVWSAPTSTSFRPAPHPQSSMREVLRGNIPAVFAPLCTSSSPDLSWNFSGLNVNQSPPKRPRLMSWLFRLLATIA